VADLGLILFSMVVNTACVMVLLKIKNADQKLIPPPKNPCHRDKATNSGFSSGESSHRWRSQVSACLLNSKNVERDKSPAANRVARGRCKRERQDPGQQDTDQGLLLETGPVGRHGARDARGKDVGGADGKPHEIGQSDGGCGMNSADAPCA